MSNQTTDASREAFEAYEREFTDHPLLKNTRGGYADERTQDDYRLWQAALSTKQPMPLPKNEFIKRYADKSGTDIDVLLQSQSVDPCDCGKVTCEGWQMVSKQPMPLSEDEAVRIMAIAYNNCASVLNKTGLTSSYRALLAATGIKPATVSEDVPQPILDIAINAFAKANEAGHCPDHCVYEAVKAAFASIKPTSEKGA